MLKKKAVFLIICLALETIFSIFRIALAEPMEIGTTFSQVQCEYLGLDWKETYQKTLSLGFDVIRLGAYWNRIEKKEGSYDFSELDWQIKKAEERNVKILLTVGMKAPRWPEYFIPHWLTANSRIRANRDISENNLLAKETLEFIRKIVLRYGKQDCIVAWQVENEPLTMAGPNNLRIGEEFLKQEVALVKSLDDKKRPIVINALTYPNKFLRFLSRLAHGRNFIKTTIDIADIPALNVYPAIGHKFFSKKICFVTNPKERVKYLKSFIKQASMQNKNIWITELQAEPWEPGELVHLGKEPPVTCEAAMFLDTLNEMRSLGVKTVLLWGVEYWFFRQKQHCDCEWSCAAEKAMLKCP